MYFYYSDAISKRKKVYIDLSREEFAVDVVFGPSVVFRAHVEVKLFNMILICWQPAVTDRHCVVKTFHSGCRQAKHLSHITGDIALQTIIS